MGESPTRRSRNQRGLPGLQSLGFRPSRSQRPGNAGERPGGPSGESFLASTRRDRVCPLGVGAPPESGPLDSGATRLALGGNGGATERRKPDGRMTRQARAQPPKGELVDSHRRLLLCRRKRRVSETRPRIPSIERAISGSGATREADRPFHCTARENRIDGGFRLLPLRSMSKRARRSIAFRNSEVQRSQESSNSSLVT